MDCQIKNCIINVGIGAWYPKGFERLKRSLIYHGYAGDILTWTDFPNNNYDKSCIYNAKAAAFEEAIKMGYTHIMWNDCSAWAIQSIDPIFDIVNEKGYYLLRSGYNCAQTCSDKCLDYFGVDRDTAETYPDSSSCVVGVNIENPEAKQFIERFIQAGKDGVFVGSRLHDNQSEDPRFCWHRQDQSAVSMISNMMGLQLNNLNELVSYYSPQMPGSTILALRGL